jgi:hypothetical protein
MKITFFLLIFFIFLVGCTTNINTEPKHVGLTPEELRDSLNFEKEEIIETQDVNSGLNQEKVFLNDGDLSSKKVSSLVEEKK